MTLDLKLTKTEDQSLITRVSVPCSPDMKYKIDDLKKVYGRSVNEKIRQFFQELIEAHEVEKAS